MENPGSVQGLSQVQGQQTYHELSRTYTSLSTPDSIAQVLYSTHFQSSILNNTTIYDFQKWIVKLIVFLKYFFAIKVEHQ